MSIVKLNNRSVKDITAFGSITSLGSLTHIATQTASSSTTISFTSGIDSTYKEYIFYFVNIHPSGTNRFQFNGSSDSGSNYNVTKTTTVFTAGHREQDDDATLTYQSGDALAQSTAFQDLMAYGNQDADNDHCLNGTLHLFNPSSTTFVKHFISRSQGNIDTDYSVDSHVAGYFNTTSAINAVQFKMTSGNIDSGQILLFGIN